MTFARFLGWVLSFAMALTAVGYGIWDALHDRPDWAAMWFVLALGCERSLDYFSGGRS